MNRQKTVSKPAVVEGRGLFSGRPCRLCIRPADEGAGLSFRRTDVDDAPPIPCDISRLARSETRRTVLISGGATVATVEHVLSAVWGMGVDNAVIELDSEEPPDADGSPLPFAEAIRSAGVREQSGERELLSVREPTTVSQGEATLSALPGSTGLDILYDLDYPDVPSIGRQVRSFRVVPGGYLEKIAPARTFLLAEEAKLFQSQGWGAHLDATRILVMDEKGAVSNKLRFADEHVRHKIGDLIGDLALLGRRLEGRILASRSGHRLNHQLVRGLREASEGGTDNGPGSSESVLDIRGIMRLLPHRYPFLMVDRIVETEGDERAVGIKNVTINEPYFQGHYPGQPIMPGVMILEAMAQISGILLSRRLEHAGKVAVLLSMDRVKMRRPVHPGDQIHLEAEALRVRPRMGHCACRARVSGEVVAEAEIKFMLVDAEPA